MLSIGGIAASHRSVDSAPQGLLIFDMTAQVWKDNYDAKAKEYVRAKRLEDWYQRGSVSRYYLSILFQKKRLTLSYI